MRTLGITGRSGCGKSTVTALFRSHGVPVADADQIARDILLPGSPLLPLLAERFGADIRNLDGTLNRHLLADRAFATPAGTRALTAVTQPEILARIEQRLQAAESAGADFAFVDGAVIVGTPFERRCDGILLITVPYEISVARICARDGIAPEMARRRLDAQTPLETLRAAARWEVVNDGSEAQLKNKIGCFLRQLREGGL